MTLGLFKLPKGATVSTHRHENEQLTYVIKGTTIFHIDGKDIKVKGGEVIHVPSLAEHSVEVIEDSLSLDIFSPPRDDWK
jgi:quercetin dioxygenase-like cupin family protein